MTATVHVRPVRRDPKTGLLCQYPAYEGWVPLINWKGHARAAIWGANAAVALYLAKLVLS